MNTEFDLYEHHAYLNTVLFDGMLEPIELRWHHTKSRGGLFVSKTSSSFVNGKRVFTKTPMYIELSGFYTKTEEDMRGILAHEMIHQYLAQFDIRDNAAHGTEFHRMLRMLNAKGIVRIPLTVDSSDI